MWVKAVNLSVLCCVLRGALCGGVGCHMWLCRCSVLMEVGMNDSVMRTQSGMDCLCMNDIPYVSRSLWLHHVDTRL